MSAHQLHGPHQSTPVHARALPVTSGCTSNNKVSVVTAACRELAERFTRRPPVALLTLLSLTVTLVAFKMSCQRSGLSNARTALFGSWSRPLESISPAAHETQPLPVERLLTSFKPVFLLNINRCLAQLGLSSCVQWRLTSNQCRLLDAPRLFPGYFCYCCLLIVELRHKQSVCSLRKM